MQKEELKFTENMTILHLDMCIGSLSFKGGLPVAKQNDILMILFPKVYVPNHGQDPEEIRSRVYDLSLEVMWDNVVSNYTQYATLVDFARALCLTQGPYQVVYVDELLPA